MVGANSLAGWVWCPMCWALRGVKSIVFPRTKSKVPCSLLRMQEVGRMDKEVASTLSTLILLRQVAS